MKVNVIPFFEDNFAYLVQSKDDDFSAPCFLVDPADAPVVLNAVQALHPQANITHILTTHKHADHSGGNEELAAKLPNVTIIGGKDDQVPAVNKEVTQGDSFQIGTLKIDVLQTPCHTRGHVLYLVSDTVQPDQPAALFSGDTLFIAGCGRFFEGNAAEMHEALNIKAAALPANTLVYCGHEYTVSNLQFAQHVEPNNQDIKNKLTWAKETRAQGKFTVPSTIADELKTNPFMRVAQADVQSFAKTEDLIQVMHALREAKNGFKASL